MVYLPCFVLIILPLVETSLRKCLCVLNLFELQRAQVLYDPPYSGQRALRLYAALCKIIKNKNICTRALPLTKSVSSAGVLRQWCAVNGVAQGADGPHARSDTFHRQMTGLGVLPFAGWLAGMLDS